MLKQLFDKNEQRIKVQPERLYQRVSAQYCDLICRVGFQKEFAPPAGNKCEDIQNNNWAFVFVSERISCKSLLHSRSFPLFLEQRYGSGIYFSSSVEGALKLWRNLEHEQYLYIIQAQVLTGNSAYGSPDLILPPSLKEDPLERYDSLSDKEETRVIFNGQQALPQYLIICTKSSFV